MIFTFEFQIKPESGFLLVGLQAGMAGLGVDTLNRDVPVPVGIKLPAVGRNALVVLWYVEDGIHTIDEYI